MTEAQDRNAPIINEFRANQGQIGGPFQDSTLLLLHSTGARTGQERVNPVMYQKVDGGYAIFASNRGRPTNSDWYYNLVANPEATIEVGTETIPVTARVAESEERERIWAEQKRRAPGFAQYEKTANRIIPVVVLEPRRS